MNIECIYSYDSTMIVTDTVIYWIDWVTGESSVDGSFSDVIKIR